MSIIRGTSSGHPARPWQSKAWVQLLAVALGPLSVYATLLASGLLSEQPYSTQDFIQYTTVISVPIIILLLLFAVGLFYVFCMFATGKRADDKADELAQKMLNE